MKPEDLLISVYSFQKIMFSHGEGSWLFDENGKKYLDFASGIATTALGHNHPVLTSAISDQAGKIIHCPASFLTKWRLSLAKNLVENSIFDKAFFANSGAEANEAALKLARKWAKETKGEDCIEVICFENAFHGRTMGTISYSGSEERHKIFAPLLSGAKVAPFNDLDAVEKLICKKTAAIIVEPIQGEGGVIPANAEFLKGLRKLADTYDVALIFDEVQTGMGRLGTLFAYEFYGVFPDIITLGKGLGCGYPISAVLARDKFASHFRIGDHGTTLGGNPLACRVACTVLEVFEKENILENVRLRGRQLKDRLAQFGEVRGEGLLIGIEAKRPLAEVLEIFQKSGLLVTKAGNNVLRFVPALTVTQQEVEKAVEIIRNSCPEGI